MGRPPIGERAMTPAECQRAYRARLRDRRTTPPAPDPVAAAATEVIARIKGNPAAAAAWLRDQLGGDVAQALGRALVPPGIPFGDLFPMPYEHLVHAYRRGKVDEARLREVRDAIDRLLVDLPQRWDQFCDDEEGEV